jgi:dTDP-4-amino-4,6-dideoxygalactose transaminase
VNSRLDELQAAILRVRLPNCWPETALRRLIAASYRDALQGEVAPVAQRDAGHVYHLFPVRSPRRESLQSHLARAGVETLIPLSSSVAQAAGVRPSGAA